MMRRRSLLRIDNSITRRRRVALQQRTSISARAGSPSIDSIDIATEPNAARWSPVLRHNSFTFSFTAWKMRCNVVELGYMRRLCCKNSLATQEIVASIDSFPLQKVVKIFFATEPPPIVHAFNPLFQPEPLGYHRNELRQSRM
jgi:hypothetical protein